MQELQDDDLDYQAEEALTLLGQIVAEQHRFDRFEELARHMGARHWKRIIVLADRAVKQRKRQLAVAVFAAALSPGMHEADIPHRGPDFGEFLSVKPCIPLAQELE